MGTPVLAHKFAGLQRKGDSQLAVLLEIILRRQAMLIKMQGEGGSCISEKCNLFLVTDGCTYRGSLNTCFPASCQTHA